MKTILSFIGANCVIGGGYYALGQLGMMSDSYPTELILFYSIQSFGIAGLWHLSYRKYPLQGLLIIMIVRLLSSAAFLGLKLYLAPPNPIQYVIHFVILYFAYLVFELAFFLSNLAPSLKQK